MSKDLKAYMVCLAIDPEQLSNFIADPERAMERAGLSPEHRAVLLSGDQYRIFAALTATTESDKANEGAVSTCDLPPASSGHPAWAAPWTMGWQPNLHPVPWGASAATCWCPWGYPWWQGRV
jgi:hypothetical protein